MTYKRIGRYWHRLTTPLGTFYGHNRKAVFTQANEAEVSGRRAGLHLAACNPAPVLHQPSQSGRANI